QFARGVPSHRNNLTVADGQRHGRCRRGTRRVSTRKLILLENVVAFALNKCPVDRWLGFAPLQAFILLADHLGHSCIVPSINLLRSREPRSATSGDSHRTAPDDDGAEPLAAAMFASFATGQHLRISTVPLTLNYDGDEPTMSTPLAPILT